jgi:prepilin-type processing-associated H-X9-DG protein
MELVAVIAVISLLMATLFPAVNAITEHFQRTKAAKNLKMIALAHANFISDFGRAIGFGDLSAMKGGAGGPHDANLFAAVLAKKGYIRDVSLWTWDFDYWVKKYKQERGSWATKIYNPTTDRIAPEFAGKGSGGHFPLSVACCVVQCPNYDYTQLLNPKYPCACSRGLGGDGRWKKKSDENGGGIWGDRGGLIAFFDGHVEWFDHIGGRFKKYNSAAATTNLCETLPHSRGDCTDSCFVDWTGNGSHGQTHN